MEEYGSTLAQCMAEIQALANDTSLQVYDIYEKLDERVNHTFWIQHLDTITKYWKHLRAGGAVWWPSLPPQVHVKMHVKMQVNEAGLVVLELVHENVPDEMYTRWTPDELNMQYTQCRQLAAQVVLKATDDREARLLQATADKEIQSEQERLFVLQSVTHDACLAELEDIQERLGAAKLAMQATRKAICSTDTANMTAGLMLGFIHLNTGIAVEQHKNDAESLVLQLIATPKPAPKRKAPAPAPDTEAKAAPAQSKAAPAKAAPAQSSTKPQPKAVRVQAAAPSEPAKRPKTQSAIANEDSAWKHKVDDIVYVDAQHPTNKMYDGLILMAKVEARIGETVKPRLRVKLLDDNWLSKPDKSEEQLAKELQMNKETNVGDITSRIFSNYPARDDLLAKTDITTLTTEYRPMDLIKQWTYMVTKMERYRVHVDDKPANDEPQNKRPRN
jgi:hypothetical protein